MCSELFHQRYSELGDEVRTRNKREDRLLDIRLKYYEREKNIRLNILRKEQYQLERTRSSLMERLHRLDQDKQKSFIPAFIPDRTKLEASILQFSLPEFFNSDLETSSNLAPLQLMPPIQKEKPITPKNVVRPHSAC